MSNPKVTITIEDENHITTFTIPNTYVHVDADMTSSRTAELKLMAAVMPEEETGVFYVKAVKNKNTGELVSLLATEAVPQ